MKIPCRMFLLSLVAANAAWLAPAAAAPATEAPAGFDDQTIDASFVTQAVHDADRATFEETETEAGNGLGPIYNAQSCRECHQSPNTGAISQIAELRVGHYSEDGRFEAADIPIDDGAELISGRSLVNDRAVCARAQERVPEREKIRAFRLSLNTLGDGFVEALDDKTLEDIASRQCKARHQGRGSICGQAVKVPVLEAPNKTAVGRFGWKDQHASLRSFASDAYLNEMGITNTLLPKEFTKTCATFVQVPNDQPGADGLEDSDKFARFMRASKVPPRDDTLAATPAARRGEQLFVRAGCDQCHVPQLTTAPAGTALLGGTYPVPDALADKVIHPYSDFLLHDIGTGDGIAIAVTEHYGVPHDRVSAEYRRVLTEYHARPGAKGETAYARTRKDAFDAVDKIMDRVGFSYQAVQDARFKLRTPPLWGLSTHSRLMHDGQSVRLEDAIRRHRKEAAGAASVYRGLSASQKSDLLAFLQSL